MNSICSIRLSQEYEAMLTSVHPAAAGESGIEDAQIRTAAQLSHGSIWECLK